MRLTRQEALLYNKYCHSPTFYLWICPLTLSNKNDFTSTMRFADFSSGSVVKNPPAMQESHRSHQFNPWVRKIPWRRAWQPTAVFLPAESQEQRSLVGYSPWGHKELDMTEVYYLHLFAICSVIACWYIYIYVWKWYTYIPAWIQYNRNSCIFVPNYGYSI